MCELMKTKENGQISKEKSILIVDDEPGFRDMIRMYLQMRGFEVKTAKNGSDAINQMVKTRYDIVVTDVSMPEMDGLTLLDEIKIRAPQTAVIIITGFGTVETAVHAMKQGAFDFFLKPFDMNQLVKLINRILKTRSIDGRPD